jgi:hypothetical protein
VVSVPRLLVVCGVAVVAALTVWLSWPRADVTIVISEGGAARVRLKRPWPTASAPLADTVALRRGATVRLVNRDTIAASLGLFSARPGDDLLLTAPADTGTITMDCSAHPGRPMTWAIR